MCGQLPGWVQYRCEFRKFAISCGCAFLKTIKVKLKNLLDQQQAACNFTEGHHTQSSLWSKLTLFARTGSRMIQKRIHVFSNHDPSDVWKHKLLHAWDDIELREKFWLIWSRSAIDFAHRISSCRFSTMWNGREYMMRISHYVTLQRLLNAQAYLQCDTQFFGHGNAKIGIRWNLELTEKGTQSLGGEWKHSRDIRQG